MKRLLLVGAAVAAIFAGSAHAQSADKLLNASYDVARELFVQVNAAYVAAHPGITIDQSHAGTSKQARAIVGRPGSRRRHLQPGHRHRLPGQERLRLRRLAERFRQQGVALLFAAVLPGARRQSEGHQGLERSRPRRREGHLPQSEDVGQCALHLSGGDRLRQGGLQRRRGQGEGVRHQDLRQRAGVRHRRPRRDHDLRRARDRRRADHLRIRDDAASPRSSARTSSSRVTPSVSLLAEFPVAIVDKVVDKRGLARSGEVLSGFPLHAGRPEDRWPKTATA